MEKKPKLQVSQTEAEIYKSVYKKIEKNVISILQNKQKCLEFLMKKGSVNVEQAEQIYEKSIQYSDKKEDGILDQHSFFCLLKFLAAVQSSIDISEIDSIYEIKVLPPPQLNPPSKKKSIEKQNSGSSPMKKKKDSVLSEKSESQSSIKIEEKQEVLQEEKKIEEKEKEVEEEEQNEKEEEKLEDISGHSSQNSGKKRLSRKQSVKSEEEQRPRTVTFNPKENQQQIQIQENNNNNNNKCQQQENLEQEEEEEQKQEQIIDNPVNMSESTGQKCSTHHIRTATFGQNVDPENEEQVQEIQNNNVNSTDSKKQIEVESENSINTNSKIESNNSSKISQKSSPEKNMNFSGIMEKKIEILKGGLQRVNEDYSKNILHSRYESIKIINYEERKESFLSKTYVVYNIETKLINKDRNFQVQKRYSDFVELDNYFKKCEKYQGIIIPQIPPKNYMNQLNTMLGHSDQQFIEQRQTDLQIYLQNILEHELLQNDVVVEGFLTEDNFETPQEYQQSLLSNVGSLVYNLASYNIQDLQNISSTYLKAKWDQYMQYDQEEKNQELGDIINLMQKVDNYEQILQSCRQFLNKSKQADQIQKNSLTQLYDMMPGQMDFEQVSKFKMSMFNYVEKFDQYQKMNIQKKEKNLEISIKKQISCIYGIKQQYENLCQILFEVNYYNKLSQKDNTNEEQRIQINIQQNKQNKHKNAIKNIFMQELQTFINKIDDNIGQTLDQLKEYQQEAWAKLI